MDPGSEDVDLIVVVPTDSKTSTDRCLKGIGAAVGDALGVAGVDDSSKTTTGRKRTTSFDYPTSQDPTGLRRGVLLELRAHGGTLPADVLPIRSLIAEHGPTVGLDTEFEEAVEFDVRVLNPTRTLVEKLMILHHAAVVNDKAERVRVARHYYDVWCLLSHQATRDGFIDSPCDALAKEVLTHTEAAGLETSPRPTEGFGASPAGHVPASGV